MCDLIASPRMCSAVREDPSQLRAAYELTDREAGRLAAIARHHGMTAACSLYRANRLLDEFWAANPETNVHFFVECDRFCGFLESRLHDNLRLPADACEALAEESAIIRRALAESHLEAVPP
jgi:hypothetical protein